MSTQNNLIKEQIEGIDEAIRYFSNPNKPNREVWVVNEFLSNLGIIYEPKEVIPNKNEPPDIIFRDALFEIKEIQDKERKRHKEYKEKLMKAQKASDINGLFRGYTPIDISMDEITNRIQEESKGILYSPEFCSKTDLLFYINLLDTHLSGKNTYIISEKGDLAKWRSVSILKNRASCVLCTSDNAPEFLRNVVGKIIVRKNIDI